MKTVLLILVALFILLEPSFVLGKDVALTGAEKGYLLYSERRLDKAVEAYDIALSESSDPSLDALINFNKAVVFYKREEYPQAAIGFLKSMATDDKVLEAKASYNLGNTKYRLSQAFVDRNIDISIKMCEQALYYYKLAIESGIKLKKAVYNYEFVKKKLDYLLIKKELNEDQDKKQQRSQQQQQ